MCCILYDATVAHLITVFATHQVAAVTGWQSTVINIQAQITHRWRL